MVFGTGAATLQPGDRLFLYSDGVTEAMDAGGGMFGAQRLEAALTTAGDAGAEETMRAVRATIDAFAAGVEQYDDITMLGFRRTPGTS